MHAEITEANEKYTTKTYINVHIAFIIQKPLECIRHVEKYICADQILLDISSDSFQKFSLDFFVFA